MVSKRKVRDKEPACLPIKCYWCGKHGDLMALDGVTEKVIECPKCRKKINIERANFFAMEDWG